MGIRKDRYFYNPQKKCRPNRIINPTSRVMKMPTLRKSLEVYPPELIIIRLMG